MEQFLQMLNELLNEYTINEKLAFLFALNDAFHKRKH
jgi:hypothetical protein